MTLEKSRRDWKISCSKRGRGNSHWSRRLQGRCRQLEGLSETQRKLGRSARLEAKAGAVLLLPNGAAASPGVLLGTGGKDWAEQSPLLPGALPGALPPGDYRFASTLPDPELARSACSPVATASAATRPEQWRKPKRLVLPDGVERDTCWRSPRRSISAATSSTSPANDLGPAELEAAAREIGTELWRQHQGHGRIRACFPTISR